MKRRTYYKIAVAVFCPALEPIFEAKIDNKSKEMPKDVEEKKEERQAASRHFWCSRRMLQRYVCALTLVIVILIALIIGVHSIDLPQEKLGCAATGGCSLENEDSLRFLLIGDTGGLPIYPYKTIAQGVVKDTMVAYARNKKIQMILNMGDNIYFTGVSNEFDSRFESSFENIYDDPALKLPWYMISGNHDHFGNVSAQIAYTKYSDRWVYPDFYYKLNFTLRDGTTVDVLMLDTIVLCGNTADVEYGTTWDLVWNGSKEPDGPKDIEMAEKQWKWIATKLNESTADYLFVSGHYPVYSMSSHGPTKCLVDRLKPLLEQYRVTAYFAGHDHTLQHITVPVTDDGVNYIVSGAASRSDRSTKHMKSIPEGSLKYHYPTSWNPFSQLGFSNGALIYTEVNNTAAHFVFMNGKGEVKYETLLKPRKPSEINGIVQEISVPNKEPTSDSDSGFVEL